MPRQARRDAPDTLHHVRVRGLERRRIVRGDTDRRDFVARVGALAAGSRRAAVSRARDGIASLWMEGLGRPGRPLAAVPGVRPQAVYQAGARGRHGRAAWDRLLESSLVMLGTVPCVS